MAVREGGRLRRRRSELLIHQRHEPAETSGVGYDPQWDKVVEAYFASAITQATDPDGCADQIEAALGPSLGPLAAARLQRDSVPLARGRVAELPPPVPGTART